MASEIDIVGIARSCGYSQAGAVSSFGDLDKELCLAKKQNVLKLIEVKCAIGARDNLGRLNGTLQKIKMEFMQCFKN